MRAMLYLAGVLVFITGVQLFVLTEQTDRFFAWTIKPPLTAATLGAAYWASCVLEIAAARKRVWVQARIAVPTVLIFTALTFVITLIHLDRFHLASPDPITQIAAWAWLIVYAIVPLLLSMLWVIQARVPGSDPARQFAPGRLIAICLLLVGLVLIPVGAILLIQPTSIIPAWPWLLTPLTARAIGAWALALGIAMIHALWERDWSRIQTAALSVATFGGLELIALARYPGDVNWALPQSIFYLGLMIFLLVCGSISSVLARRHARTIR
jgi:hypothetical protein